MRTFALIAVFVFMATCAAAAKTIMGTVEKVISGDTILVQGTGKVVYTVRLWGIDSPEPGQPYFREAKAYLEDICMGSVVRIRVASEQNDGVIVGKVHNGEGVYLNENMAAAGYAWYYKQHGGSRRMELLCQAARESRLGLWSDPKAVAPWVYKAAVKADKNR